jgi:hypothetical protein
MFDLERWHTFETKEFSGVCAAVPGQNPIVLVDQYWIVEPEALDRSGNLPNLSR